MEMAGKQRDNNFFKSTVQKRIEDSRRVDLLCVRTKFKN